MRPPCRTFSRLRSSSSAEAPAAPDGRPSAAPGTRPHARRDRGNSRPVGRGLAYATGNPSHLLNVRAANMSAFADDPDHFARWLADQADARAGSGSRVPFRLARSLRASISKSRGGSLAAPEGQGRLEFIRDEARALRVFRGRGNIDLLRGRRLRPTSRSSPADTKAWRPRRRSTSAPGPSL